VDIKCFVLEESDKYRVSLRRFTFGGGCANTARMGHAAIAVLHAEVSVSDLIGADDGVMTAGDLYPHSMPGWPTECSSCGHKFKDSEEWQYSPQKLYVRRGCDDPPQPLSDFPAGAMWRSPWLEDLEFPGGVQSPYVGLDGQSWTVRTPGGDWLIDGRANNCGSPTDTSHKCWCRHGEAPDFTVDKIGATCSAGAGSIVCGNYHGFLRNGFLTDC